MDANIAETLLQAGATLDESVALALGRTDWLDAHQKYHAKRLVTGSLPWAIAAGCPAHAIAWLLRQGANLDIHSAAALGDTTRLTTLLGQDTDAVRDRDAQRNTPLHLAAAHGHLDTVRALLNAGASRDALAGDGATPLHRAISRGHLDGADLLLGVGARADLATHRGDAPLHAACAIGYDTLVTRLLNSNVDANTPGTNQDTPLHRAAEYGHPDIVRLLLTHRADPNRTNFWGGTALHVAARTGHASVVDALLTGQANLLARDRWDRTALHIAAYFDHPEVALRLLDAGIAVTELSYGFSTLPGRTLTPSPTDRRLPTPSPSATTTMPLRPCLPKRSRYTYGGQSALLFTVLTPAGTLRRCIAAAVAQPHLSYAARGMHHVPAVLSFAPCC